MKTRSFVSMIALSGGIVSAALAAGPFAGVKPLHQKLPAQPSRIEVFVQLDEPSVAALNITAVQATGAFASREAQQAQAKRVENQQQAFRPYLDSIGAKELGHLRVGANGLRIRVDKSRLAELQSLPGVRSVGRVPLATINNGQSVAWIGAPVVWSNYGVKGEHVKIGLIDTGIDYTHANFGGSGNPADYAAIDPNNVAPGTFPTAKVVGGYDFAGPTYNAATPGSVPAPDANPLDKNGHGSHTAGTAAGIGVPGIIAPGVAPAADLYAIKVFGDAGGSTDLVSEGIEWAMNPNGDADMSDHLDVVNLSLGSDFGDPNSAEVIQIQAAVALGMFVSISAGNAGAVPYIVGDPAVTPGAIAVAATNSGGETYSNVNVTSPAAVAGSKLNLEGTSPVQLANVPAISASLVPSVPFDSCNPITNGAALSGQIALIERGTCSFVLKVQNAEAAGAVAVVVYEQPANGDKLVGMTLTDPSITVPAVMIGNTDGTALAASYAGGATVQATLSAQPDPTKDDQIASFSSRGPGSEGTTFKPEISAPGVNILSTLVGGGTAGTLDSGTSMSAPHIAGSAALLHQLHPKFTPAAVKALLMNSTVNANPSGDTDLARQGVGVVRVNQAAALTSYASPAAISFGRVDSASKVQLVRNVTVRNFGKTTRTFTGQSVPHKTYPGLSVQCPQSVTVPKNQSVATNVNLSFDPTQAFPANVTENWLATETEADGWCILSDGTDTLRIGYLASVDADSVMSAKNLGGGKLAFSNVGPAPGIAQGFTLVGTAASPATTPTPERAISFVGARHQTLQGYDTVQIAVVLNKKWEHISQLEFLMQIDVDNDGVYDVELDAADLNVFQGGPYQLGTFVTAQTDLHSGQGFIDWNAIWDFNDRVVTLPFSSIAPASGGFVPDKFSYKLTVFNPVGSSDTVTGTVDLTQAVVPEMTDFVLDPNTSASVGVSRSGTMLWIYPGNEIAKQAATVTVKVK